MDDEKDCHLLLTNIGNIVSWLMEEPRSKEQVNEALELIESICRHKSPLWTEVDAEKYGLTL